MPLKFYFKECDRILILLMGQVQCSVGNWVFACFQPCGMVALF